MDYHFHLAAVPYGQVSTALCSSWSVAMYHCRLLSDSRSGQRGLDPSDTMERGVI